MGDPQLNVLTEEFNLDKDFLNRVFAEEYNKANRKRSYQRYVL